MLHSYDAVYRALVTSNTDSANLGKIIVQCPQISGAAQIRAAEPINPSLPVPAVGSTVWVAFSGGDLTKPLYFTNTDYLLLTSAGVLTLQKNILAVPKAVIKSGSSWQTPVLGAQWALGDVSSVYQPVVFRMDAEDNLRIVGTLHTVSITPSNMFTVTGDYIPTVPQRPPVNSNASGVYSARSLIITTGGVVSVDPPITTNSTDLYIDITVPRGNIS